MPSIFTVLDNEDTFTPESIGVSTSGRYVVSSNSTGAYLETVSDRRLEPIQILTEPCDSIGFFGHDIDVVAMASGDHLRILQLSRMAIVANIIIRPGSLFVPRFGESAYVGVTSEAGQTYIIDQNGIPTNAQLKVGPEHNVIWSPGMTPAGYTWTTDDTADLYIRSVAGDKGAILSSSYGITLYSVHMDASTMENVIHLVTHDEPHVLKKVVSAADTAIVTPVLEMDNGITIDRVAQLPDGRPLVASGHQGTDIISVSVDDPSPLSRLVSGVMSHPNRLTSLQCYGHTNYLSWTQTPVTPPVASVTNYSQEGRPRYEIATTRPQGRVFIPETNEVHTSVGPDKKMTDYRIVSRYKVGQHTADNAVVICDSTGSVSSGKYSPVVSFLYEMGVTVVILPVPASRKKGRINDNLVAALDDVSSDLMEKKVARRLSLIASDDEIPAAVRSFNHRRSRYDALVMVDPVDDSARTISNKNSHLVQMVSTGGSLPAVTNGIHQDAMITEEDVERVFERMLG